MVDVANYYKFCRTCLKEVEDRFAIFQVSISIDTEKYLLKDMFLSCLSTPLFEEDALPKAICRICLKRLHNAFTFKKQCDQSYFHLMKLLRPVEAKRDNLVTVIPTDTTVSTDIDTDVIPQNVHLDLDVKREYDMQEKQRLQSKNDINLYDHTQTHKDDFSNRSYSCTKCTEKFSTRKLLQKHVESHNNSEMKLCPICGKAFKFTSTFELHMRHHSREKTAECLICTKKFMDKNKLKIHMRIHTGEKPYVCQMCGKAFAQYGVLKTHLTLHTGRPVICKICNQGFSRKSQLTIHMRRHTGERPFNCDKCTKGFIMKSHLKEHLVLHSRETPYVCKECGCTFKQVCTLRMHEKTHLLTLPYNCAICDLSFIRQDHYGQHMELHLEV